VSDLKFVKGEEIAATKLNRLADRLPGAGPATRPGRQFCAMFFTPIGGIPGRDGQDLTPVLCERVTIVGSKLTKAPNETEPVVNISLDDVGEEKYIQCLWIEGVWVANWEDCGEEGSSSSSS
jgi:hypothetical protein